MSKHKSEDYKLSAYYLNNDISLDDVCEIFDCPKQINEIGGREMYKCDKCKLEINRDINGARNIYNKTIAKLLC
jgi:hypothetical protein